MKRIAALLALALLPLSSFTGASAGPTDGWESEDVEYVKFIPFEVGTATGAKAVGDYFYVTSWKDFSIYDISDPLNPELLAKKAFVEDTAQQGTGFRFENEDVATNGRILVFSQQLPVEHVFVYDIEDKTNPTLIGHLTSGGAHTAECVLDCKWLYGSNGNIWDLRDPSDPKQVDTKWGDGMPVQSSHDVNEVAPGLVLTSSRPIMLLDARKDPTKPKLLAVGDSEEVTGGIHSNAWPRKAKDKFVMFSSETNATGRCGETNGHFMTWDASKYKKSRTFTLIDSFRLQSGTYQDGSPAVNGLGCSAHWFQENPTFKNGGMVALGSYEHGTRFVRISNKGKISEEGYFIPHGGSTSAAYWLNNRIVYAIDYTRGIDILKWNGKL